MTEPANTTDIACSLNDEEFRKRRGRIRESLLAHVVQTEKLESGLRLIFAPTKALRTDLETLVELERQCCGFLSFTIASHETGLMLSIEGRPEAQATLATLAACITN